MISSGGAAFKRQYAITPIIFTGGVASMADGGALPFSEIAQSSIGGDDLDDVQFTFQPVAGSTLIDQQIGMYPFLNKDTAANATIKQPKVVSLLMICPAGRGGGYTSRQSAMQALQGSFEQHNAKGGTYSIMTPTFIYTDCVMLLMTDVSGIQTKQAQYQYKLDFIKPLISQSDATQIYNSVMSRINQGLPEGAPVGAPPGYSVAPPAAGAGPGGSAGNVPLLT